jgi:hypothetical protein
MNKEHVFKVDHCGTTFGFYPNDNSVIVGGELKRDLLKSGTKLYLEEPTVPAEVLETLREIRLFHWKNVLRFRNIAKQYTEQRCPDIAKDYDKLADKNLSRVQALNYFFNTAEFDTAENDYKKELEKCQSQS